MRLNWIDALKGIGIMLVVLGHHSLPAALDTYIFSFHMPLFFFISGFLFDFGKYSKSGANFVKGKFRSLLLPYFFFAFLTCLFYCLLDIVYQPKVTNIEFCEANALYRIYSILYALGPLISYNPPLWFLPCLFVTELLFYGFAKKYYLEPKKLVFWLIVIGILGYLYAMYVPFRLLWNADVALTAVVFYGAGNLFRKFLSLEGKSRSGSILDSDSRFIKGIFGHDNIFNGILILLNILYIGYLFGFPTTEIMNMNILEYGNFFSFYFLAFSGTFAFVYLFKQIGSSRVLEYYGRNSIIVLALHFPIKDILTKLAVLTFGLDIEHLYYNAPFALILTALNLLLMVPIIILINNYFPFLLGKKRSCLI
ncbi:MAG: acetyltransferase [Alphaproteobacteria bacterium]|nr:MAG: acetyltransferase [Alphaproteobacteria bacterium]